MTRLKVLIVLLAAASAFLLAGAGSASATVLCKKLVESCGTNKWGTGTELAASVSEEGVFFLTKEGALVAQCTGGVLAGKTSTPGSEFEAVKATMSSWTWSCSEPITTVANGEIRIDVSNVNGVGGVTLSGFEVTINPSIPCTYGSKNELFGVIVGAEKAPTLQISTKLKKTAGSALCVSELRWEGEYTFGSPTPLWVVRG
jgi:hypothetical protein